MPKVHNFFFGFVINHVYQERRSGVEPQIGDSASKLGFIAAIRLLGFSSALLISPPHIRNQLHYISLCLPDLDSLLIMSTVHGHCDVASVKVVQTPC